MGALVGRGEGGGEGEREREELDIRVLGEKSPLRPGSCEDLHSDQLVPLLSRKQCSSTLQIKRLEETERESRRKQRDNSMRCDRVTAFVPENGFGKHHEVRLAGPRPCNGGFCRFLASPF